MKKVLLLISLFSLLIAKAQTQDSIYFWKNGAMIHKRSIKTADLDSISFKRPVNLTGINIPGPNVTDIDGNTYQSVSNCGLTFTKQNLNVSKYTDGTPIPQVTDPTQWANLTTGAWCYYNNDPANGAVYGKLYNWYAVAGIYDAASAANPALRKKLAPTGWHIPTDAQWPSGEWNQLINCLGGATAGGKMKSMGTIQAGNGLWQSPNVGATNSSGFTGTPAGGRLEGLFVNLGNFGYWWSSLETDTSLASLRALIYSYSDTSSYSWNKSFGFSVRCVKD